MTPNKRDLKAYVRFDGTGRVVPGSLVLRRSKPKVGKWQEVETYECCNPDQAPIVVTIDTAFPFTYPDFVLHGDGPTNLYFYGYSSNGTLVTNLTELATSLNNEYSYIGHFNVIGSNIVLTPLAIIAEVFKNEGSTALSAITFAD